MRVAVVGSGISGLSAAWALRNTADVTLFEADARPGGHSCTVDIDVNGTPVAVDVGFIVCNPHNYKNLLALFAHIGVETYDTDMSFAVADPAGFQWSSNPAGLFGDAGQAFNPRFWHMVSEIFRFSALGRRALKQGTVPETTLGVWCARHRFGTTFLEGYLKPMGAAIWSTAEADILDYPALSLLQFFDNHRLLHIARPLWRTVVGGSRSYVRKLTEALGERVRLASPVSRVTTAGGGQLRVTAGGGAELFDHVILAGHSDQSLKVLDPEFGDQTFALRSARYAPNTVYLHRDLRLMPQRRGAWAAWNVMKGAEAPREGGSSVCVTYWMNALQKLGTKEPVLVTLNPAEPPDPALTWQTFTFDHPQFDLAALAATREIKRLQGDRGLWFAGAWLGHGFHEDGLKSGLEVAVALGAKLPWEPVGLEVPEVARARSGQTTTFAASGLV
jgi:predicted NAD/FAD-binding protein